MQPTCQQRLADELYRSRDPATPRLAARQSGGDITRMLEWGHRRTPATDLEPTLDNSRMIDLEIDDGLAVITIDRPHARNAISLATMDRLDAALDGAAGARALVIKGAGDKAFVSGGDLKDLSALRTEEEAAAMAWRMRGVCDRIAGFPGPVLAALNGHALGGGAEVAVAADIRLAADDVKIGFNQVTLEIMPAWGGAERLAALVGKSSALLLAGGGTILTADEAQRVGLVQRVVPRQDFETEWRTLARTLAHRAAGEIKRVIGGATPDEAVAAFARLWVSEEHWAAASVVLDRSKRRSALAYPP